MRVRVSRVSAGGSYARVTRIGPDRERAFVLVPGIGVMSNYFERLAFRLADFGPVIAVDLPGFGGVPHPPGGTLDVLGYADVLGQVLDALDLIDPIVLGHSMGTQIAAELATRRRLSDLVLISPVVNPRDRALPVAALRFAQSTLHEPPKVWALSLYAYALSGLRWTWRVLPDVLRFPIEDTLTRVEANTLVLTGEQDRLCPRGWAREVGRLLSTAQVWRVPGAAHSVMHRGAEDVARLCVAHVRRELPPDGRYPLGAAPGGGRAAPSAGLGLARRLGPAGRAGRDPARGRRHHRRRQDPARSGCRGRLA